MVVPLPKWLLRRYATLWKEFHRDVFTHEDARNVLDVDSLTLNVLLSELRKAGWLERTPNPEDQRRKRYKLIPPERMMMEMEA
ncbi:MAG: SAM-dependent DNA methyltransferase, partial [Candidatus Hodarchaeales archaeon]